MVFALLFFVCRLCVGPFVVYATVASSTTPMVVKAGAVLATVIWLGFVSIPVSVIAGIVH